MKKTPAVILSKRQRQLIAKLPPDKRRVAKFMLLAIFEFIVENGGKTRKRR